MLARIYINRHIIQANKKASKNSLAKSIIDDPAICIKTYRGTLYCKTVETKATAKLIQNALKPICSGATIWLETTFENLIIDGKPASQKLFEKIK